MRNLPLDGEPIGETRLNALLAGEFGVALAFVAGDDRVCREARAVLGEDLPTYAVKDGLDMLVASCLHPQVTGQGIRGGSPPRCVSRRSTADAGHGRRAGCGVAGGSGLPGARALAGGAGR